MTTSQEPSQPFRPFLDGPDFLSPKSEIEDWIAELEQMPPSPERNAELERMQELLKDAAEEGGFSQKG